MRLFRSTVSVLSWHPDAAVASLSTLFAAVDDLALAEVRYYYRRRSTRAWISGICRAAAWLLGSAGLILPLLDRAESPYFHGGGAYGYGCLAGAASALAANSLFGGTDGHIRFVSTQLEIEKLIAASHIQWCAFLATSPDATRTGFAIIEGYATSLHALTLAETGRWGETLLTELAKYRALVDTKNREGK